MLEAYPPDLQDFVLQKIASGEFKSADEFAVRAATVYREFDQRRQELQELKRSVEEGIADIEAGNCIKLESEEELHAFGEEIKRRGRETLRNAARGQ